MSTSNPARAAYCIVVGADGSAGSRAAVAWCADIALALDANVTAVTVIDEPQPIIPLPSEMLEDLAEIRREERDRAHEVLEREWCEPLRNAGVHHDATVASGRAAVVLADLADERHADLLVVGRRGHAGPLGGFVGSVPRHLSTHSNAPVVIVPDDGAKEGRR